MDQQDMYHKANEIATEINGEYTHMEKAPIDKHIWFHYKFDDNRKINEFMYRLHINHIGQLLRNTGLTSCAVLI